MKSYWAHQGAVDMCTEIEKLCPYFGCHVALTGGLLYHAGPRKDCDILFYRIRQWDSIDIDGLFENLELKKICIRASGFGWCIKAMTPNGKQIDCLFPEETEDSDCEYTPSTS